MDAHANGAASGIPDTKVSVSQVFGFESNLEVPAYSEPTEPRTSG